MFKSPYTGQFQKGFYYNKLNRVARWASWRVKKNAKISKNIYKSKGHWTLNDKPRLTDHAFCLATKEKFILQP